MIETLSNLVRSIVILIFLTVLLEMLLPQGIFRRYLRVLAGILLILTILTPLQKIMHMAPLWDEADVFSETGIKSENLQQILAKGEALQEENIRFALQDYRSNIFTLLENELAERFGKKLLQLELSLEEDSLSKEFGSLKGLSLVVQDGRESQSENAEEIKVEKVLIMVQHSGEKEGLTKDELPIPEADIQEKEIIIERHLAAFFQLSPEKVKVRIIP